MIEIAVCDDEAVIREQLQQFVIKKVPKSHIETYATGEELLAANKSFDLVFLDIQMDSINGMDTARALRGREKEFPETHKADKKIHDMGLYHIKSTAEKYYGAVEWTAADKVFTLTVMMQNERRLENEL